MKERLLIPFETRAYTLALPVDLMPLIGVSVSLPPAKALPHQVNQAGDFTAPKD